MCGMDGHQRGKRGGMGGGDLECSSVTESTNGDPKNKGGEPEEDLSGT